MSTKIDTIQKQIIDTKEKLHSNLKYALEQDNKLNEIEQKTVQLKEQSTIFQTKSNIIKRQQQIKRCKWFGLIAISLSVLGFVVYLSFKG
jgi:hypothetical protein